MTQTNEELIKDFQNYIHGYRAEIDADKFDGVRDRFFCKGMYEGMLVGLELLKRISSAQPEQLTCKWKEWSGKDTFNTDCCNCFFLENNFKHCPYCGKLIKVTNEPEGEVK